MSTPSNLERLREIACALPRAVYPHPDWDQVHALEDEAATLLGKRTVRQADDVVSGRELWRQLQAAIAADPNVTTVPVKMGPVVPESLRASLIQGAVYERRNRLGA